MAAPRVQPAVLTPKRAVLLGMLAATLASCHAIHPLEIVDGCRCSPSEYCLVRPASSPDARGPGVVTTSSLACKPLPKACGDTPSCACLGRPIDACREELGAFTVLEPRSVAVCDECSTEEYCWQGEGSGHTPSCRLIPARCESTPTCACLQESRRPVACNERRGRIEASAAGPE